MQKPVRKSRPSDRQAAKRPLNAFRRKLTTRCSGPIAALSSPKHWFAVSFTTCTPTIPPERVNSANFVPGSTHRPKYRQPAVSLFSHVTEARGSKRDSFLSRASRIFRAINARVVTVILRGKTQWTWSGAFQTLDSSGDNSTFWNTGWLPICHRKLESFGIRITTKNPVVLQGQNNLLYYAFVWWRKSEPVVKLFVHQTANWNKPLGAFERLLNYFIFSPDSPRKKPDTQVKGAIRKLERYEKSSSLKAFVYYMKEFKNNICTNDLEWLTIGNFASVSKRGLV